MTSSSQSGQLSGYRPERMPGTVKWAIAIMWFQAALNAVGAVALLMAAQSRADVGQDGVGVLRGVGVLSLVVVVLLAACAIVAVRGISWGWWLASVLEVIAIINGLITLVSGNIIAVVGIALAVAAISLLSPRQAQAWYGR